MPAILSKPDNPHKKCLYEFTEQRITVNMLKTFAQANGLKTSGNKTVLMQRCAHYQLQQKSARLIQKRWRGFYTRLWIILKCGSKIKPVNDTDFYTLEPIKNMPFYNYLHYTDPNTQLGYVFNVISLLKIFSKTPKFENPYTRASMQNYVETLIRICRLTHILYLTTTTENNQFEEPPQTTIELVRTLFIEIDLLGHYTCVAWFLDLDNTDLCNFYNNFCKLWQTLTDAVHMTIFPDGSGAHLCEKWELGNTIEHNQRIFAELGITLLKTTGDRSLGVFYFLMALTTVSQNALEQYAFLYETYVALVGFMN
jgi:hypothetical protein